MEIHLIPIPPGYGVRINEAVGIDFVDENGRLVIQHPKDDNHIRRLVWEIYRKRETKKKAKYQFVSWFPQWKGIFFKRIEPVRAMSRIYEWVLFLGFWEVRKWRR